MGWYIRSGGALLLAAGLVVPALGQGDGARPQRPLTREMLRQFKPADLLRGLDEIDPQAVRANVDRYRLAQAERVLTKRETQHLQQLISNDSLARRNQALLTGLLRDGEAISGPELVVGAVPEQNLIYVLGTGNEITDADSTPFLRSAVIRATPNELARGLTRADFQAIRYGLSEYRVVRADRVLSRQQLQLLERLLDRDSLARRNRNLLTNLLRQSELVTNTQRVVGVTEDPKALFVLGGR